MKLIGENAAQIMFTRKSSSSDLIEIIFSCEWCAGQFEFYSSAQDFEKLRKLCGAIAAGRKSGSWLSEEGDLELKFTVQSLGQVRASAVCCPSAKLTYPGKLEFEVELELSSFDNFVA